MATCGEVLVRLLERYGIDTIFGIPGVHTVELYRGLGNSSIRHVTPRHEQGAGFMADGYARVSGRPAACFIITGPGLTNIATALGQAYGDSVPMLVISSVNRTEELGLGEGRLHELPSQRDLMAGLTAFSHTLMRAEELPQVLARAYAVFGSARPRPVHIELPLDVITAGADDVPAKVLPRSGRPAPDPAAIAEAAELLGRAKRPLVVLGGGAQDAALEARKVVERLGAPAVTTINGKGILPPGHPLSLGSTLPQRPVLEELTAADVVLAVGTELGETDTLLFEGRPKLGGKLIRIDIDADELVHNALPELAILSDAGLALQALSRALEGAEPIAASGQRVQKLREQLEGLLTERQRLHRRFLTAVQEALPDVVVVGDSTQPVYSANLFYEPARPRSFFNASTGYGTLGYALPAALGAKLAEPDRPVVALIGDGGIQFTIGELAAAVELSLPVPILLWNNHGYGEIREYMAARGIPQIGVDIYTPDLLAIAQGYGCEAVRATSLAHLKDELRRSQERQRPTVIEIDVADARSW
ncbi:MAG TPA: 5-guanidino-2-oxopentanoate decarboxylase [Alphaproteobacteria bacterium]|nr:5-guanidino-2-oxopentanoate decarboxylase [Alphaproteobacteria bacterium]